MRPKRLIETWPAEADAVTRHDGPVFFDAELAPNRSLRNPAFIALMGVIGGVSFVAGIVYISIGAWPVMGFFGLDVFLIWLAFRVSYRDGRAREWIRIDARDIEVTRRHAAGHMRRFRLPTGWTQLQAIGRGEHDCQVALLSKGRALIVGAFLSPREREDLAEAMARAIGEAKLPQEPGGGATASAG